MPIFNADRGGHMLSWKKRGNNIQLALELENEEEINRLYDVLSTDGKVKMELQDTVWNSKFAVISDKYGITWELNYPL